MDLIKRVIWTKTIKAFTDKYIYIYSVLKTFENSIYFIPFG